MASSLFALLDDIATLLDDISILTKVAAKKTAGVLGDDLALNAQQVSRRQRRPRVAGGVGGGARLLRQQGDPGAGRAGHQRRRALGHHAIADAGRRLPVLRGFEKLAHKFLHSKAEDDAHHRELTQALINPQVDLVALERDKIKGAVRTDFILSAEIIVITLGTVAASPFTTKVAVLVGIAILMTVGVYGLRGRHRQARRPGPVPESTRQRTGKKCGCHAAARGSLADAFSGRGGHGRHVSGGRRYSDPRHWPAAPRHRGADPGPGQPSGGRWCRAAGRHGWHRGRGTGAWFGHGGDACVRKKTPH
jgi:hypothetical protein